MNKKETAAQNATKLEPEFTKEQLRSASCFSHRLTLVEALLEEHETYTVTAVEEKIRGYMEGEIL